MQDAEQVERRFWSFVDRTGPGCWLWLGELRGGVGSFYVGVRASPRRVRAPRFVLALVGRPVPAGHRVIWSCGNPACVNPAHLDAAPGPGRPWAGRPGPRPGAVPTSWPPHVGPLTAQHRRAISEALASGLGVRALARHFGVSPSRIHALRRYR